MTGLPIDAAILREIQPGERLLWTGKPATGVRLRPADAFVIPFSLVWCGFAIFWEVSVVTSLAVDGPAGWVFRLWGIPFVLVGLYFVFGRFLVDARIRARTEYALTSERVIVRTSAFGSKVRSLALSTLGEVALSERPDGSGTIEFPGADGGGQAGFRQPNVQGMSMQSRPAFEMIPDARRVHDLIMSARRTRP